MPSVRHPHSQQWQRHAWEPWHRLDDVLTSRSAFPAPREQGIYRLRAHRRVGLLYIGLTGNLRQRLNALATAVERAHVGGVGFHPAGRCLAQREQRGQTIEVSWVEIPGVDRRELFGIECELIAAYRHEKRRNPECQFAGGVLN